MNQAAKIALARRVALISGIFTALVGLLLMLHYVQIKASDPLDSPALSSLVSRLAADPGNEELIADIRNLDLLARKAYFNSVWQIKTGAWLMLFSGVILAISLSVMRSLRFAIEKPTEEGYTGRRARLLSERWVGLSGLALILLAVMATLFSTDFADRFKISDEAQMSATIGVQPRNIVPADTTGAVASAGIDPAAELQESPETAPQAGSQAQAAAQEATAGQPAARPAVVLTDALIRQHHNAFRGPFGHGHTPHQGIPTNWDGARGTNILWKTELPLHGYNSPVIWDDYIFLTGASQQRRAVFAYSRLTGAKLWEHEATGIAGSPATPPKTTEDTGLAAPTATTDGNRVYAIFGTGDILALDFTGKRVWARNLGVPANHYGHSSSLVVYDGKVFVQYDTQRGSRVLALDAASGTTVWETARTGGVSWASPILAQVNGQYQLILLTNPDLSGYDIKTGRRLWSVNCMSGEVGPSPTYGGGLIYAANEYAKMVAVNPVTGQIVWENNYYLPEVSSLLYHNGLLYMATSFAVVACFDAATGEFIWEYDADEGFYSSPAMAENRVYLFDTEGGAYIFRPGREPDLMATPKLGEKVFASPVFAQGRMYIRGNKHLFCIGKE